MSSPEIYSSVSVFKGKNYGASMDDLFLDVGKEEQKRIVRELKQKTQLSWTNLAKFLGVCRSTVLYYHSGKFRLPYRHLIKLCGQAGVSPDYYSVNLIKINNKPKADKIRLPFFDETRMQILKPEDWQKIVAVGFLTDGSICRRKSDGHYMLSFFSCDLGLIKCFQTMVKIAFNENSTAITKEKNKNLWKIHYQRSKNNRMVSTLFNFSKTYKTSSIESQPSLDFLLRSSPAVKLMVVRFAMSCDGSVSVKCSKGGTSFALRLACAHPALTPLWKSLFSDVGIDMRLDKDKATFSGIHGLTTSKKSNFLRFKEIGGFFPEEVKVTNGKFVGSKKNQVLAAICDCLKRGKRNSFNKFKALTNDN